MSSSLSAFQIVVIQIEAQLQRAIGDASLNVAAAPPPVPRLRQSSSPLLHEARTHAEPIALAFLRAKGSQGLQGEVPWAISADCLRTYGDRRGSGDEREVLWKLPAVRDHKATARSAHRPPLQQVCGNGRRSYWCSRVGMACQYPMPGGVSRQIMVGFINKGAKAHHDPRRPECICSTSSISPHSSGSP